MMNDLLAAVEEKFLKGYRVPALLAVGLEVGNSSVGAQAAGGCLIIARGFRLCVTVH
jgi:hypothetical protein